MKLPPLLLLLCFVLSQPFSTWGRELNIIPQPQSYRTAQGHFVLDAHTAIFATDSAGKAAASYLIERVNRSTPFAWRLSSRQKRNKAIVFAYKAGPREGYSMHVSQEGIRIEAAHYAGYFYAVQSLLQLLPPAVEASQRDGQLVAWRVPCLHIEDAPRFPYRGIMLDPCRHFLPVEAVKRQIDLLAAYKINRLHWHLTDDQGWRIEIKKYPQLTDVGAWRTEADGTRHGGYYTQEEVREVVAYAQSRAIEIVPELEVPGHELAAIAALPQLSCRQQPTSPRTIWGVEDIVMCPGREDMFLFLRDVIDEMVQLFPGKLFHIGGDEAPHGEWQKCAHCQARVKSLGYKNERELQGYIVERVAKYLNSKGKQAIGWDEVLEGGQLPAQTVIMSWRGTEGGIKAAQAGHPVIMSPNSDGYYLDYLQGDLLTEPIAFSMYGDVRMSYQFEPCQAVEGNKEHLFLGVQGNAWSEYIHNPQHLEYKIFPRALAIAEVGWSPRQQRNFDDFCRRLDGDAALRLQHKGVNFHLPQPQQLGERPTDWPSCNHLVFTGDSLSLALGTTRPLPIVYSTDGSQTSAQSARYTQALTLRSSCQVRTRCVLPCGLLGPERTIRVYKELPRPALPAQAVFQGMKVRMAWGQYSYANGAQAPFDTDTLLSKIEDISRLTPLPRDFRHVRHYAAMGEFCLNIAEEGVYEFATHNAGLWVDDELLVDNRLVFIPRNSPNNAQIALSAGKHRLRTLFVGGIFQGWPTYWDEGSISMRKAGTTAWQRVKLAQD